MPALYFCMIWWLDICFEIPGKKSILHCYSKVQLFRKSSCWIFWKKHTNHFKDLTLDSFFTGLLGTSGNSASMRNTQWALIPQSWANQAAFQSHKAKQPPHSCAVLYTWKTILKIIMVLLGNLDMQSLLNCHKVPYYQFCHYWTASRHTVSLCCISFSQCKKTRAYEWQQKWSQMYCWETWYSLISRRVIV